MRYLSLLLVLGLSAWACQPQPDSEILYQSENFTLYRNQIVQGENHAQALSPTHLKSNYKSPASATYSRLVKFKFSINEKDNELAPGQDHWVIIRDEHTSPLQKFGQKPKPLSGQPTKFLPTNYEYTFLLDASEIHKQFEQQGYYQCYNGSKIAKADFKGIYIAGGAEPLTWDFVNLGNQGLKMKPTQKPHIYSITVTLNPYNSSENANKEWELRKNVSSKPQFKSDLPLIDALYNLSLEEALQNIEPDSTLRTGAKWAGVWTRDVSYSTLLAFAYHEPKVAKISLRKKVKNGRIIQDTGSGGAWPVSSDRTTWVLAAWEIYKVTGEQAWLEEIYPIIKKTLAQDAKTLYDARTGLYRGESSFLDWREQTYPKWMDNKDIFMSQNLGTNVVHYQAHKILARIAELLGEPNAKYTQEAEKLKDAINTQLWLPQKGYYAQYLYGRTYLQQSPRFETLGEALAVLFDVATPDKAKSILQNAPLTEYGATCIYPQIPGIPPYHNNGIWPFVQSFWNLAAAKIGNEEVLNHGLASVYRAAGLFLSNYENMVAQTGDFLGTEINSHRMLWSMAGNLAMVHRVFMGMRFETEGLYFEPKVPKAYRGNKQLTNFKYRNALLTIKVKGHGTEIASVKLDGKPLEEAFIPQDLRGEHTLQIQLAGNSFPNKGINKVNNAFSLPTLRTSIQEHKLNWIPVSQATAYRVYRNGKLLQETTALEYELSEETYATYTVAAVDKSNYEGFMSEPMAHASMAKMYEAEIVTTPSKLPFTNFSGEGFVEISKQRNRKLQFLIPSKQAGEFLLDFRYSNGSGPWNTDNKCGIRSLWVNKQYVGVIVFPQRGTQEWSDWGFTNGQRVQFKKGINTIEVKLESWNENMNGEVNKAMLDYLRLVKL